MDDAPVSQTLDRELAADVKLWPLVLVAALFLAGVAPAFLRRPAPPPRPATSGRSCTSTPAAPTSAPTGSPKAAVDTNGSC